jgi:transcription initiation factor TFIID subunit 7
MNDRAPIRDRTLILRILVPGLEARLRDQMKELASNAAATTNGGGSTMDCILDLEGVTCEPTPARNLTLWNFHCDGAVYPAKLVNLPCPVELQKTHDHACYYKSTDIAQMLIVYEDEIALEEAEERGSVEGFPSYFGSGLTPPMKQVVEKRFAAKEHVSKFPRAAVADVETELLELLDQLTTIANQTTSASAAAAASRQNKTILHNKVLEEVVEEVVTFEPWMNDYGKQPEGVEFDADDQLCNLHPEVWLTPEEIAKLQQQQQAEAAAAANVAAATKAMGTSSNLSTATTATISNTSKPSKKKKKAKAAAAAAAAAPESPPALATTASQQLHMDDEVTAAATMMIGDNDILDDLENDDILDLDLDEDVLGLNLDDENL